MITIDYFVQFVVVEPSIMNGQTDGLTLFTEYNPHGIFIGLEGLGYLMMSVSFLFTAFVFGGERLERVIRWLYVATFVLAAGSIATLSLLHYDIIAFEVTILLIDWVALIVSGVLLSVVFRRSMRIGH